MKRQRKFVIGVDLGATTIKSGIVDDQGKIAEQIVVDTMAMKGPRAVLRQINLSIADLFERYGKSGCAGIGIGSPGVISTGDGAVLYPPNFADWKSVRVADAVRKKFRMPVYIENDANCAAIAEAHFGGGRKYSDFIFVIWGTGVGGGIIIDKKIYRGRFGGAGEIGHASIDYNGPACNCGSRGCIESYIGQRYLSDRTRRALAEASKKGARSVMERLVRGDMNRIQPTVISQAANEGDPLAISILTEAGALLGYALASIINILEIRTVIIGGGISAAPEFVFESIRVAVRSRVLIPHKAGIRIARAKLGNGAGIIGAASLVYFR
jgi:glucokinase